MSPGLSIFVLVVILVVGWFALGTHINIRKGHRFLEWLQGGLPLIGEKTTLRWLGSSVVHLKIEKAREPFRRAEVLIVLEPRDVPLLWLFSRLRGRRDLLIVRTELRTLPGMQIEVLDRHAWSTQAVAREVKQLDWHLQSTVDNQPFQIYFSPPAPNAGELIAEARGCELPLVRVGVRRTNNSLEVQWSLPSRPACGSRAVFETIQRVAHRI
ncbi:MAG TPA: hypothetical protein VL240_13190 [Candidatus Binatia bacterium]|nr:hypothetical protein [Candidatus Binatia bacterium]